MAATRAVARQVPEPYGLVAFLKGITAGLRENKPYAFLREWHNQHGAFLKLNLPTLKVVSIADVQVARWVARNDPARFTKGAGYDSIKRGWLDNTLVVNEDEEWRRKRTIYNRAFRVGAIRSYAPLFLDIAEAAALDWKRHHDEQRPLDAVRSFESVALESIGRAGFGVEGMGKAGSRYAHAFVSYLRVLQDEITSPAMILLPGPLRRTVTWLRGRGYLDTMNSESFRISSGGSAGDVALAGSRGQETRRHLVSLIREAANEEGSSLDPEQLAREANLFLFAGHDTTSATLAWVFASLASRPDAQQRAYEEVASIPEQGLLEHISDPKSLPFVGAIIKEALRLYSPATMALRRTRFDEELGGYEIPAGTDLSFPIWAIHRDPKIFKDADAFQPERWLDASADQLKGMNDHWMPFMVGARGCIGQQFAMTEMRVVIATLLRRFSVRPASEPSMKQRMLLLPSNILLHCSPR